MAARLRRRPLLAVAMAAPLLLVGACGRRGPLRLPETGTTADGRSPQPPSREAE